MSTETKIILHIEDNEDHALLTKRALKKFSEIYKIINLIDGDAALKYLFRKENFSDEALSPRPQLILLDLRLPKVDGLEVLRQIKNDENLRPIPIVILTSSMAKLDIDKAYYYFTNSYMVKPFDFLQFREQLIKIAEYWLNLNTSA